MSVRPEASPGVRSRWSARAEGGPSFGGPGGAELNGSFDVRSPLAARRSALADVRSVWEAQPHGSSDVRSPLAARPGGLIVVRSAEDGRASDLVAVRTGLTDSTRSGGRCSERPGCPFGVVRQRNPAAHPGFGVTGSVFESGCTKRMVGWPMVGVTRIHVRSGCTKGMVGWPMVGVTRIRVRSGVDEKTGRLADGRGHQDPCSERDGRKEWSAGRRSESPGNTTPVRWLDSMLDTSTFVRRPQAGRSVRPL
jgi:hypothetical protein